MGDFMGHFMGSACGGFELPQNPKFLLFFSSGIRSWDIDLTCCNLDEQLKLFVSRHSATFSSIVKGKKMGEKPGKKRGESCQGGVG
uniref:Microtubule-associated protein 1B/S N-terminal domain-containing protein n=1 Tax=Serinus canaria TaxID=9135 RepID=A0A8C9MFN7_SERCA